MLSNRQFKPVKVFSIALILGIGLFLSLYYVSGMSNNNSMVPAAVLAQLSTSEPPSPSPSSAAGLPTIQITSVQDGQQVPPGELTVQGISSDTEDTDCEVFADVNDVTPMQNVTAAADSGDDFSTWTFTYSEDYQLISQGQNELTAKISCPAGEELDLNPLTSSPGAASPTSSGPLNEWHTVNVTGVAGAPAATLSSSVGSANVADGADGADGIGTSGGDGGDGGEADDGGSGGDGGDGGGAGEIDDDVPSSLFG